MDTGTRRHAQPLALAVLGTLVVLNDSSTVLGIHPVGFSARRAGALLTTVPSHPCIFSWDLGRQRKKGSGRVSTLRPRTAPARFFRWLTKGRLEDMLSQSPTSRDAEKDNINIKTKDSDSEKPVEEAKTSQDAGATKWKVLGA